MENYDPHAYPPFAVATDIVVFTVTDGVFQVALIERGQWPNEGRWAIPGGFVLENEDLDDAAVRELAEETGLTAPPGKLRQLGAYGAPDRDPRMRVVSITYWALVPDLPEPEGGGDAAHAFLVPVDEALQPDRLAFDHHKILTDAVEAVRTELERSTIATDLMPEEFTISELREAYEAILGVPLDPGNFQKKVTEIEGFLSATGKHRQGSRGRPAELYTADSWGKARAPSMNFEQYVDRVNFHLEHLGVKELPSQQNYVDAWNRQLGARRMAESYVRRMRRGGHPVPPDAQAPTHRATTP